MNTNELAGRVAEKHGLSQKDARAVVDTILDTVVSEVHAGNDCQLNGFGKFSLKQTAERQGRNPSSGAAMTIAAQRKLAFAPAKAVKDRLNG